MVAPVCAGVPINGVVCQIGQQGVCNMWQADRPFLWGEASHGSSGSRLLSDRYIVGHRHLRHAVIRPQVMLLSPG